MKALRRILALTLALALLVGMTTVYAVEDNSSENVLVLDHIPTSDYVSGISPYDGVVTSLSSSEAQSSAVPEGYTDTLGGRYAAVRGLAKRSDTCCGWTQIFQG